jgi:hypothetical protein
MTLPPPITEPCPEEKGQRFNAKLKMQLPSKPCNAGKQNPLAVERTGKNPSFFLYQVQNSNESLKKSSYLNALYTNCRSVTKSPHSF